MPTERETEILDRLDDKRRALDMERRGIASGQRLAEIHDAIAQIDLARGRLTRDMVPGRTGMPYVTRGLGARRGR